MEIHKITTNKVNQNYLPSKKEDTKLLTAQNTDRSEVLMKELDKMAGNNIAFKGNFELNLSKEELEKRTNKDYLITKKMLKADAPEYLALAEGDKKALKHLVKAAYILEKINIYFTTWVWICFLYSIKH